MFHLGEVHRPLLTDPDDGEIEFVGRAFGSLCSETVASD
jgi:hypothetical protein